MNRLVIRADAGTQMGTGHVMRCLSLAQGWLAEGGGVTLLTRCESEPLLNRIAGAGVDVVRLDGLYPEKNDLETTLDILRRLQPSWTVVDGYHFDAFFQETIRQAGFKLLVVDDYAHLPRYHAEILLNQNVYAERLSYGCDVDTLLLRGSRYVLLRPEFLVWRGRRGRKEPSGCRVLVTMGGSDPDNVTLKVIEALRQCAGQLDGVEARILIGASNPNVDRLEKAVSESSAIFELLTSVWDMPGLMDWADLAVTAGGTTCWELAFMGIPSLVMSIADNQRAVAEELGRRGVFVNLGGHEQLSSNRIADELTALARSKQLRHAMSLRGQELVDGFGADRVIMRMQGRPFRLRHAEDGDMRTVWDWNNDAAVRALSFSSDPIPYAVHEEWFRGKLNDSLCTFYIAVDAEDAPIGFVRFDEGNDGAVVSVVVSFPWRGKGIGGTLIEVASRKWYSQSKGELLHAFVKTGNEASVKAFLKAGYRLRKPAAYRGQPCVHLSLSREELQCRAGSK